MAEIFLSIKPRFVVLIINDLKRYELRRGRTSIKRGDRLVIYETSPKKSIVAQCIAGDVLIAPPKQLYRRLNGLSGLSKQQFFGYFSGCSTGSAVELHSVNVLDPPLSLAEVRNRLPDFHVPRSYCRLDSSVVKELGLGSN